MQRLHLGPLDCGLWPYKGQVAVHTVALNGEAMFVLKSSHAAEVGRLEALLSEARQVQAGLEDRAAGAEAISAQLDNLQRLLEESDGARQALAERATQAEAALSDLQRAVAGKLLAPVKFKSPGEAAFAGAKDEDETLGVWADANQGMWELAALEAVLFTNQYKVNEQLEYFKAGTPVPYSIDEEDGIRKVFTARLQDPEYGRIEIAVNGEYVRDISCGGVSADIDWFAQFVTLPPGYVPC